MTAPQFQRATRKRQKLKIGITGPAGSGKTEGALILAAALAGPEGRIAVIDTENESASDYADRFEFDSAPIFPPYLTSKYLAALQAAAAAGYTVAVIDSLSHQWDGDGGILQRKEEADRKPGSNHWTNWGPFTKEQNELRAALLNAPIHVICTMRSKMAYQQTESGGRKKVEKLGLQPIQREGLEYEFKVCFDLQSDHLADVSKDRTQVFEGQRWNLRDPEVGQLLRAWLATATEDADPAPRHAANAWSQESVAAPAAAAAANGARSGRRDAAATTGAATTGEAKPARERVMTIGHSKGKKLGELEVKDLEGIINWCTEKDKEAVDSGQRARWGDLIRACREVAAEKREAAERDQTKLALDGAPAAPTGTLDEVPAALARADDDDLPF